VFCASDMLAVGALTACREAGIHVPRAMSVAGFDDIEFAEHASPALTTVRVPSKEIGQIAGTALLELVRNGKTHLHQHTLATPLIVRESCAPPAARSR